MGLPSTHRRPRIHSTYCARPLHRRLHGEPPFERVPGHPRPRLRPALRAGLPPRPRRRKTGGHLPPEARRRRSTRTTSRGLLPKIPKLKNGKKVALIGAGCASLTVANDLMPLGYSVTIFEQWGVPGGLMRTNIPSFRLPAEVLNDEIAQIVEMGVDLKLNHPIKSMKELLDKGGFDAVFVGAGAPKGKELKLPGRAEGGRQHPYRHHLARVGGVRAHQVHRREGADHRRGQHGDGLLPHVAAPRREGREGHGAQAAPVLQGLGLGARGRRGRTRQDHHQPLAEELRARERQAEGHDLRRDRVRPRREGRASPPSGSSARNSSKPTT